MLNITNTAYCRPFSDFIHSERYDDNVGFAKIFEKIS